MNWNRANTGGIPNNHIVLENKGSGLVVNNLPVEDCIDE